MRARSLLLAFSTLALGPAAAAAVTVATTDGLALELDAATGRVLALRLDGLDYSDWSVYGGLYVRDRARLLDVPPASLNLVPNASFEM